MQQHSAYWKLKMREDKLILAGPVLIDVGTFGILVVRATDLQEAEELVQHDPAVIAHVQDYEIPIAAAISAQEGATDQYLRTRACTCSALV